MSALFLSSNRALTQTKDWLPNHVLVVILTLVFAVLNPLLTPFALLYFIFENGKSCPDMIHDIVLITNTLSGN